MKKNVRVISLALAALLLVSACFCITGCKKHKVKMTEKADAIEYLFTCALLVNAELTILRADSVMDALVDFAVEHNVSVIVLGASPQDGADSFADKLALRLPDVELDVVRAARDR